MLVCFFLYWDEVTQCLWLIIYEKLVACCLLHGMMVRVKENVEGSSVHRKHLVHISKYHQHSHYQHHHHHVLGILCVPDTGDRRKPV